MTAAQKKISTLATNLRVLNQERRAVDPLQMILTDTFEDFLAMMNPGKVQYFIFND